MKRILVSALAAAVMAIGISAMPGCNGANDNALNMVQTGPNGFMIKTLVRGNRTRKYGLFIPASYKTGTTQRYPTIVFLHGVGEGGSDAHANLRVGLAPFVALQSSTFPFICIFPQSDSGSWDENSENASDVIAEIDQVAKDFPVDQDRVCLTGLSTGGYGTWAIGAKYKDRFAALVPMGSSANADKYASELTHMPIWSFHNSGDPFAATWNDSTMVNKIKSLGGSAQYTEYSAMGHDCWETAYGDGELFAWMQQQHRPRSSSPSSSTPRSGAMAPTGTPAQGSVRSNSSAAVTPSSF